MEGRRPPPFNPAAVDPYPAAAPPLEAYPQQPPASYGAPPPKYSGHYGTPGTGSDYQAHWGAMEEGKGGGPHFQQGGPPARGPESYVPHDDMGGQLLQNSGGGQSHGKRKCNDIFFALLFYIHLGVVIGLGIWGVKRQKDWSNDKHHNQDAINSDHWQAYLAILSTCALVAFLFASLMVFLVQKYPRKLIIFAKSVNIIFSLAFSIYFFSTDVIAPAIVFLIIGLLNCVYLCLVWRRIPFASVTLAYAGKVIGKYPSLVGCSVVVLFLQLAYWAIWCFSIFALIDQGECNNNNNNNNNEDCTGTGGLAWLMILLLFWAMEVFRNIVHVTTSGTVGAFYFHGAGGEKNAAGKSLWRALTTSFGSICFGSLLVAIIQTLRSMASSMRRRKNNILACLCECIFQCLERIIRYFNAYAYVQVAIYGVSYLKAAKNTFKLISRRGLEGLINDNLVGPVLFLSSLFGAGLTFLIAYLWAGSYGSFNSDERVVVSVFALLIGFVIVLIVMSLIASAVMAIFVCWAEQPDCMERNDPVTHEHFKTAQAGYSTPPGN